MTRYQQTRFLGSGTYARVYEAIDTLTSKRVALKKTILNIEDGFPATSLREISLLKNLNHPNIINLLNIIHTPKLLILVFEYFDYDLKKYISIKPKINIFYLTYQLLEGVSYLHQHNVLHRDLKPQNILVNCDGKLKIADFGLARTNVLEMHYNYEVVTLWYRSLELLGGLTKYKGFIDMWSVGCIICEMSNNIPLFMGRNENDQVDVIKSAFDEGIERYLKKRLNVLPAVIYEIILGCLDINYMTRITAEQCLVLMNGCRAVEVGKRRESEVLDF